MKNSSKTKSLVAAFVLYAATLSTLAMAHSGLVVWIAPSLHRVGMAEPAGSGTQVSLSGARNGYQSFQIVVSGASDSLSNVNVRISDLEGPSGEVIPRTSFSLYREKYVYVSASSPNWGGPNQPLGKGWYTDGLIPFADPETGKPLTGATFHEPPA